MLREKIDQMISKAAVEKDPALDTLRLIKAEFQKYNASKEAVSKPMDDAIEIQILNKMVKQRKESEELYLKGNRSDLAQQERAECSFIETFLPAPVTEQQIRDAASEVLASGIIPPQKKNMGLYIRHIKNKYPTADGKLVSQIVSSLLQ